VAPIRPAGAASAHVAPGTCFAEANVDADEVDLFSKVACSRDHAVQVLVSTPLPKALARAPHAALVDPTSAERVALLSFVRDTCTPAATAAAVYPATTAKRLGALFDEYRVTDWMAPAAGSMGWVLPDAASYDAGAKELLCVHVTDDAVTGSRAGDVRDVATRKPLPTMRICQDFLAGNTRVVGVPCDGVHDVESLIWVSQDVTGKPAAVAAWTSADWKSLDDACRRFAVAVIGAKRADVIVNADTDPSVPADRNTRFVNCRAYPADETDAWAAGTVVTGAGRTKLAVTPT